MFDRLNSGGVKLNPMEIRRGVLEGEFLTFVRKLAEDPKLHNLAPLSPSSIKRRDYDELVSRFFAYTNNYKKFNKKVVEFVDQYIEEMKNFKTDIQGPSMKDEWETMLSFVERNFQCGFLKGTRQSKTPRVRFEAISVGVALALREISDLRVDPEEVAKWAYGKEFHELVTADGANSRAKVVKRIEYVRDKLLESRL